MGEDGFAWENLPAPLMRRLERDLHLGPDPAEDLQRRYGNRPGAVFVQDAWPALRDSWLRTDAASRARVVAALIDAGAGEAGVLGTPDGETAFLSTVTDAATLQRIVAAEVGRLGAHGIEPAADPDAEWDRFITALARSLEVLEAGQRLLLSDGDTAMELSIGAGGTADVADGDSEPVGAEAAAASVVAALREAGVAAPDGLVYRARTGTGEDILLPLLGIPRERSSDVPAQTALPDPVKGLRSEVEDALRVAFGLDELRYDTDGDIPLRFGSAMIFVRISDDSPVVRVFAPMLWEVPESSELLRAVNEINLQIAFARVAWDGKQVSVRTEFVAHPFEPMQLMAACQAVGGIADHFDDRLQGRFGGRIFFGKAVPTKDESFEYGGYL